MVSPSLLVCGAALIFLAQVIAQANAFVSTGHLRATTSYWSPSKQDVKLSENPGVHSDDDVLANWPREKLEPLENVALDSVLGKTMFAKLLMRDEPDKIDGENIMTLLRYLETQVNLGACAPASAVTVLNALDYKRPQDPVYSGYLTDAYPFWTQTAFVFESCVKKTLGSKVYGETLEAFGKVMKCLGLNVEVRHSDGSENFAASMRDHIETKHFVIANFDRSLVHQKPGGHFSPIGGYVEGYFLILDVARYKYAPVFVPCADLVAAMGKRDEQSGMARGYVAIWK